MFHSFGNEKMLVKMKKKKKEEIPFSKLGGTLPICWL
jgi:hypothetical protein